MSTVLAGVLGLIGVGVGLLLGSGFTFWVTYRAELANGLVAVIAIAQALESENTGVNSGEGRETSRPGPPSVHDTAADSNPAPEHLDQTWREHRGALAQIMSPNDFWTLARCVQSAEETPRGPHSMKLAATFKELHEILWRAHERFILRLFLRMARRNRVSNEIHDTVSTRHREPGRRPATAER